MSTKRTVILSSIYVLLLILVATSIPKELDWGPDFKSSAKIPYGSYVLFEELGALFPEASIKRSYTPIYNQLQENTEMEGQMYVIITDQFTPDSLDWQYLKEFALAGNKVFIAAEQIGPKIEKDLNIYMNSQYDYSYNPLTQDSIDQLKLRLFADQQEPHISYSFNQMRRSSFIQINQDSVSEKEMFSLSEIEDLGICYARIPFGRGTFYIHSVPYVFTNYNMLYKDNQEYIAKTSSFLAADTIIWDDYYKPNRNVYKASSLSVLLSFKAFKWAYWIGIGSLILFFIFRTKRDQRMIPIIKPYQNSSESFAKTISGLFFEHATNKEIAIKKIRLLKEHLHIKYYLEDIGFSDEEALVLSFKSAKPLEEIKKLFINISNIERAGLLSDAELLKFSEQLNHFLDRN